MLTFPTALFSGESLGPAYDTLEAGVKELFETSVASYISAVALSETTALVAYSDGGSSSYGTAVILSVSGSTITTGTPHTFTSTAITQLHACVLSSTSVLVAYSVDSDDDGNATILSISGTTISSGSAYEFLTGNVAYLSTVMLSSTTALIIYSKALSYEGSARVATVSGSTISYGTEHEWFNTDEARFTAGSLVSANKVLAIFSVPDGGGAYDSYSIVLSVSGTTVTSGSSYAIQTGLGIVCRVGTLANDKAIINYRTTDSATTVARVANVSGTVVSLGTAFTYTTVGGGWHSIGVFSSSYVCIGFSDTSSDHLQALLKIDSDVITLEDTLSVNTHNSDYINNAVLSGTQLITAYQEDYAVGGIDNEGASNVITMSVA
jgi:hypothetical protein